MKKDYLSYENTRNKKSHKLFTDILTEVFGKTEIVIAHHICYEGESDNPEEIPSADTLIFDHGIMAKIFGEKHKVILIELATTPVDERDAKLAKFYYERQDVDNTLFLERSEKTNDVYGGVEPSGYA